MSHQHSWFYVFLTVLERVFQCLNFLPLRDIGRLLFLRVPPAPCLAVCRTATPVPCLPPKAESQDLFNMQLASPDLCSSPQRRLLAGSLPSSPRSAQVPGSF